MSISVLIPTYNRRQYLVDTIASALAQNYDGEMEVIVIDDCSTDGTEEALRPYLSRIRYLRTGSRGGPALAKNLGMRAARGDYIAFLDDDDLYYPYKLRLQAKLLDARPEVGMVYSEFSAFADDGFWDEFHLKQYHSSAYLRGGVDYDGLFDERQSIGRFSADDDRLREQLGQWADRSVYFGDIHEAYLFNTIVFTNSMLFRRSLLDAAGLQDPRFRMFHDLEFALRLTRHAKVAFLDVPTYKLRYHPGQMSTTQTARGELVAIKIQRDLLRVTKYHALLDRAYYARNKAKVDRQLARLCRAVAVPLLAFVGDNPSADKRYARRARRYLLKCGQYGQHEPFLLLLSCMPHGLRRIGFKLLEIRSALVTRLRGSAT